MERRGWEVDEQQGLNHQSWVEGSLVACAVAAAVEAAAPIDELSIPPAPPGADPKGVDSGGSQATRPAGDGTSPPLASLLEGWTGHRPVTDQSPTDAARAAVGSPSPGAPLAKNDRADVDEGPVDNVERAFRDPAYHHPASLIHHFPDIAHHNLLLERTREEMPQTKPIQKSSNSARSVGSAGEPRAYSARRVSIKPRKGGSRPWRRRRRRRRRTRCRIVPPRSPRRRPRRGRRRSRRDDRYDRYDAADRRCRAAPCAHRAGRRASRRHRRDGRAVPGWR